MFAIKKFVPLLTLLVFSCGKNEQAINHSNYSSVIFFNNSSYYISIHSTSFSGPLLVDKLESGKSYSTMLNPSDNYGAGSVFSIEYWYLVANDVECSCGDVWIGGIDPDMQISQNMVAGGEYPIQIQQPKSLELNDKVAFFKILNTSGEHIELHHLNDYLKQIDGVVPVPSGKIGIYKMNGETEIERYAITQISNEYPLPEFTAKSGYIYDFEFNGNSVKSIGEGQKIF